MATSESEQSAKPFSPKMRLLLTKLCVPLGHPDSVPRARLLKRLDQGAHAVLTLISAPAGFGKTTLLADWIRGRGVRAAWLSLDAGDNDAPRFWTYVVAALDGAHPGVGETTLSLLQSPQRPPLDAIVAELINALAALPEPVVLALDDFHVVETAAIHKTLSFLIENCPPHFRVILASRRDPPLPLARLRARRQLVELRAAELRFTPEEVSALLGQSAKLGLSSADIALLQERTEGWAAGLQLAALSLQTEDDATSFIRSFGGSHRYVFDYLAQEILRRQPAPVRSFLLRTAILDRLSGPLCDAVTERADAVATLAQLEQSNLFLVPLDQERRWYRYHQLFAEFLRSTLAAEVGPQDVSALHRRAGLWLAQNGLPREAVAHLFAAGDEEAAAQLIETHVGGFIERNELDLVAAWSRTLPTALLERHPGLSIGLAWALVATLQIPEAERCVATVERGLGLSTQALLDTVEVDIPEGLRGPLVEAGILRSVIAVIAQDPARALAIAQSALPYLVVSEQSFVFNGPLQLRPVALFTMAQAHELSGDVTAASAAFAKAATLAYEQRNVHLFPMALSHLAQLQLVRGKLHAAAQTYRQALQLAKEMSAQLSPLAAMAYVGLGNLLYEWNDLDGARHHLEDGIALGRKWHNLESLLPGFIGLARLRRAHGDWTGAYAAIDEAAALARAVNVPAALSAIAAVRAAFAVAQGDLETAARWAASSGLTTTEMPDYLREAEAIVLARVLLAQGRLAEAHALLGRLGAAAAAASRSTRTIEVLVLQALAYDAQGEAELALDTFQRALALAVPEGFCRLFVDEGAPVARLLLALVARGGAPAEAASLLAAFPPEPGRRPHSSHPAGTLPSPRPLAEALSDREQEVLDLIAAGLSNEAIADQLVVSVNTVKTHVRNLYGKLGTGSRTQTVARARELGLLPS